MKKKLLYLGLITGSFLFTACSEDSKTTEKTAVLGVQHVEENEEMSQVQTASEESTEQSTSSRTEQTTEARQTTSTTEQASTIKESDKKDDIETSRLNEKNMKIGIIYMMKKGETIKKVSSEPKLLIETDIETGETTATLLEGKANIKKNPISFP